MLLRNNLHCTALFIIVHYRFFALTTSFLVLVSCLLDFSMCSSFLCVFSSLQYKPILSHILQCHLLIFSVVLELVSNLLVNYLRLIGLLIATDPPAAYNAPRVRKILGLHFPASPEAEAFQSGARWPHAAPAPPALRFFAPS